MADLLKIPDDFFSEAARAIASVREINESNINAGDIEKVVRSYVYLGQVKKIPDWSYLLNESQKDSLVKSVQGRTQSSYSFRPEYGRTWTNMDLLETLGSQGRVSPNVARPRAAQEAYEGQLTIARANDPSVIEQGLERFSGWIKKGSESLAKGLGFDLPGQLIILLVVALVLFLFIPKFRGI